MPAVLHTIPSEQPLSKQAWRIAVLVSAAIAISYLDRQTLPVATAKDILVSIPPAKKEPDDWLFPSVRRRGKQPRVANMLVEDYLRPAAAMDLETGTCWAMAASAAKQPNKAISRL
jgi:hypothetical protein